MSGKGYRIDRSRSTQGDRLGVIEGLIGPYHNIFGV
jgi:hypothetical protein